MTVSTEDMLGLCDSNPTSHCLSEELMKLIDSGGSGSPSKPNQNGGRQTIRDFDAVSNFEFGFQQRLSQLERNRLGSNEFTMRASEPGEFL